MTYDIGDTVPLGVSITGDDGSPVDAATVTLTIDRPDGTTDVPTLTHPGVGDYRHSLVPDIPGTYGLRWASTSPNTAYADVVTVAPVDVHAVSLTQVKDHLNITATTSDDELRELIGYVCDVGEQFTGRVFGRRSVTSSIYGCGTKYLPLPACPILTVETVVVDGVAVDPGAYLVGYDSGVLTATQWTNGATIVVAYTAGYARQPGADVTGALRMCAHLWKYQRGSVQARGGSWSDEAPFAIPNFVAELWALNLLGAHV